MSLSIVVGILFGQQRQLPEKKKKNKKWKKKKEQQYMLFRNLVVWSLQMFFVLSELVQPLIFIAPWGANVCNCIHHRDKIIHLLGPSIIIIVELKRAF